MRLYAISDLHLDRRVNREAVLRLPDHGDDWLILAGDVGDTVDDLRFAIEQFGRRFARLLWVPGNHELWSEPSGLGGVAKYQRLVALCREHGVVTPEDPYPAFACRGRRYRLAPLFLLYDYSFRPPEVPLDGAVDWSADSGVLAADELYLEPTPYPTRADWCRARCSETKRRLVEARRADERLLLINHWPLRFEMAWLPRIPRFSIWCGTRCSEDWHVRFGAAVVIYGHLHIRGSYFRDGVRFEEVSLGYPRQWHPQLGIETYLREILPG